MKIPDPTWIHRSVEMPHELWCFVAEEARKRRISMDHAICRIILAQIAIEELAERTKES